MKNFTAIKKDPSVVLSIIPYADKYSSGFVVKGSRGVSVEFFKTREQAEDKVRRLVKKYGYSTA